jgi:broad specificity phosphatase PhoE
VVRLREDPRISEQQFGNFQDKEQVRASKVERHTFGRFYYRFPNGESGLDVYMRVSSFVATLFRDHAFSGRREAGVAAAAAPSVPASAGAPYDPPADGEGGRHSASKDWQRDNILIVTHGLTLRLLLMRYYQWSVRSFERTHNPHNAELIILERKQEPSSMQQSTPKGAAGAHIPGHFALARDGGILRDLPQSQWTLDNEAAGKGGEAQMRLTEPPPGAGPWPLNSM